MVNNDWSELYITDRTDKKFFVTKASPLSVMSEINNLKQHLKQAIKYPHLYKFLDLTTAVIMVDGHKYNERLTDLDDILLDELFSNYPNKTI